jgi:hypothetical protein
VLPKLVGLRCDPRHPAGFDGQLLQHLFVDLARLEGDRVDPHTATAGTSNERFRLRAWLVVDAVTECDED